MMDEITREDGESFRDFHARALAARSVAEFNARRNRHNSIAEILKVETYQVYTVIDLNPDGDDTNSNPDGTYVVEYSFNRRDNSRYWIAVVGGKKGNISFNDRRYAILDALAFESGTGDDRGAAATFAARTLALPPDAA